MEFRHPGQYIQQELTKRGRTQKDFAHILGKKVSEINELIKGKRNITIQRDILLGIIFDSPAKKWIGLQMEYDYAISSQLFDSQKIEDTRFRKNLLEKTKGKIHDQEKEIVVNTVVNTVAYDKQSSTIQDTKTPNKNLSGETKDRKREHEIFRNF